MTEPDVQRTRTQESPLAKWGILTCCFCMLAIYWWGGPQVSEFQLEKSAIHYAWIGNAVLIGLMMLTLFSFTITHYNRSDASRAWFTAAIALLVAMAGLIGFHASIEVPAMRARFQSLQANERSNENIVPLLVVVRDELERMRASGGGSTLDLAALSQLVDNRIPADKRSLKAGNN